MVLVDECLGLFVYRVTSKAGLGIQSQPEVGDDVRINDLGANAGELFAVECVHPSRVGSNNGTYFTPGSTVVT